MLIYFLQDFYDEIADQIFKLREQREKCTVNTAARDAQIARINELARKAKAEGLTDAEIEERAALRQEYLNAVMANARSVLENTYIVDEKGNKRKLRGKGEGEA